MASSQSGQSCRVKRTANRNRCPGSVGDQPTGPWSANHQPPASEDHHQEECSPPQRRGDAEDTVEREQAERAREFDRQQPGRSAEE